MISKYQYYFLCELNDNVLFSNYVTFYLAENASYHSTKTILLNLQTEFSSKIQFIMADSGTENIGLKSNTPVFLEGVKIEIIDAKQQMLQKTESEMRYFRKLIRSLLNSDSSTKNLPSLTVTQFNSTIILLKECLNSRPLLRNNKREHDNIFLYSPNMLMKGYISDDSSSTAFQQYTQLNDSFDHFHELISSNMQLKTHIYQNLKNAFLFSNSRLSNKYYKKSRPKG